MVRVRTSGQTTSTIISDFNLTNVQQTVLLDASINNIELTLPLAINGEYLYRIKIIDTTKAITFATLGGDTIDDTINLVEGKTYTIQSDGVDTWMVVGAQLVFGTAAGTAMEGNDDRVAISTRSVSINTTEIAGDDLIECDPTSGAITVGLLPVAGVSRFLTIKYVTATNSNLVTINPDGVETIDGQTSYEICTEGESLQMVSTPTGWVIITSTHNEGQVKINTGNLLKPTLVFVGGTVGTFLPIEYATPLGLSGNPTTTWPKNIAIVDRVEGDLYDFVNDTFLENRVPGQLNRLRVIMTFSNKSAGLITGIILRLENTLSGFVSEDIKSIPNEITNGVVTFELTTIADSASLPSPWGTGQGYKLTLYADDPIDFVIDSVARISAKK